MTNVEEKKKTNLKDRSKQFMQPATELAISDQSGITEYEHIIHDKRKTGTSLKSRHFWCCARLLHSIA